MSRYHLNFPHSPFKTRGTLCNWLSPVYAITGNPVTVYLAKPFFVTKFRRLQRCLSAETSTPFLLQFDLLTGTVRQCGVANRAGERSPSLSEYWVSMLFERLDHPAYYS